MERGRKIHPFFMSLCRILITISTNKNHTFPTYSPWGSNYLCSMNNQISYPKDSSPIVLIVDDHDLLRTALRVWLSMFFPTWQFMEATSGEDALDLSMRGHPDLVLMDVELPVMNGIETTRQLKKLLPETKVVMLSVHEEQAYRGAAAQAGANAYIGKSMMYDNLVSVLSESLTELDGEIE